MKITIFVVALMALASSGCIYVSAPPRRTVVQETRIVAPRETVITTLPPYYRARVYRGTKYYEYNNVYYRAVPRGYVIVERPW